MEELEPQLSQISHALETHYTATFLKHGATSRGADWGPEKDLRLRYEKMLEVIPPSDRTSEKPPSVLDVGCGFGGLLSYAQEKGLRLGYTGIDVSRVMVDEGRKRFPDAQWLHGDALKHPTTAQYDYVLCNGILTQKLKATKEAMRAYERALIPKLFALCSKGAVFNVMTSRVNFEVENLNYRNPVEMLTYCLENITRFVRLDHAYPLYEYSVYLYRSPI